MQNQKTGLTAEAAGGITRRQILLASGATALGLAVGIAPSYAAAAAATEARAMSGDKIKALLFDVQGTIVDFYSTIVREGEKFTKARGIEAAWTKITEQWRGGYRKRLDDVISGKVEWRSTDVIYRDALDDVLAEYPWGDKLSASERDELNGLWSRLDPWPDTVPGLARLRRKFTLSTLSNGSMASVVGIVKHGGLPMDAVLTAELVKSSKPDPKVYALGSSSLALRPEQILMVACHKYDLAGAKKFGFNVAFIQRPLEFGPAGKVDTGPEDYFDFMAPNLEALAGQLGA
jgi:2-haloacid dehalogenase